jgi:uncharacterized FAD-dependent dehydrogenase
MSLVISEGKLSALTLQTGEIIQTNAAILAIGHSARDTFYSLRDRQIMMEAKPFAIGVRIEHPQSMMNMAQYGMEDPY